MNEKNNIPVIRKPDGTLMFPTWRTQAFGQVRRQFGNVLPFPAKAQILHLPVKARPAAKS